MRLDKDLVREILLAVEANDDDPRGWIVLQVEGYSQSHVSYHVQLLHEAGYLEAQDLTTLDEDGYEWQPKRLTFQGHEFLDTVRDTETWRRTKMTAKDLSIGGLKVLFEIARGFGKHKLLEHGISIG
jgi:DNA-binding transcriptional ArsR family regulator